MWIRSTQSNVDWLMWIVQFHLFFFLNPLFFSSTEVYLLYDVVLILCTAKRFSYMYILSFYNLFHYGFITEY